MGNLASHRVVFDMRPLADRDAIVYHCDARRRPSGSFCGAPLRPGVHFAIQTDSATFQNVDPNRPCLDLGMAFQRSFDASFDVDGRGALPNLDLVRDAHDAGEIADGGDGVILLKLPLDLSQ